MPRLSIRNVEKSRPVFGNRAVKSFIWFAFLPETVFSRLFAPLFPKNAAAGLGKIFCGEIHALHLEALSVQGFQRTGLGLEGEGQLVRVQGLVGPVEALVELAVLAVTLYMTS